MKEDSPAALQFARLALTESEGQDSFFDVTSRVAMAGAQEAQGDLPGAVETLRQVERIKIRPRNLFTVVAARTNLGLQLDWQGKRREALAICRAQ
jgi:hypothetical protein